MIFFVKYNQRFKLVHMRGNKQTFEVDKSLLVLNLFLERNMGGSLILLVESIWESRTLARYESLLNLIFFGAEH